MDWSAMPPLAALRAFEAAARLGGFSAAGRELNVTHAAVGQQVRSLERWLGTILLRREGRGVALTAEGQTLAEGLREGFRTMHGAIERVAADIAKQPLRVTMTPSFAAHWFMPRYGDFRRHYPDHDLVLHPTGDVVDLEGGDCDVAIRYGDGAWPGLEVRPLLESKFVIVGAPDLVEGGVSGPEDLTHLAWFQEVGSDEVARWQAAHGLGPETRLRVTEMPGPMVLQVLREGAGLAATADMFVADDIAEGRLVVYWQEPGNSGGYWVAHRKSDVRPAVRDFVRWISAQAAGDNLPKKR